MTTNEHRIPEISRQNGRLRMPRVNISTNISFSANTTPTICSGSTRTTTHCNQTHAQPSNRFCCRETWLCLRAVLAASKLSRCDSLRLVLVLCLPTSSPSRGQRSTQNTRTLMQNVMKNTVVLRHRFVFMRPSLQPLVPLLFELPLVHTTFTIQRAKLRHEFRCSWFHNGDVVAKRVDANLADLRPLLEQANE